jgi:hypothetical protein
MTKVQDYTRQFGLEYITKDLNVEFTPHRAADDAYATMKVVEAMCKMDGLTLNELEEKYEIIHGRVVDDKVQKPMSKGFEAYCTERDRFKQERSYNRSQFYEFLTRKHPKKSGKLFGKVFNFSRLIEDDLPLAKQLVNKIYDDGGKYTQKLDQCNIYVCEQDDTSVRSNNARLNGVEIIDLNGLRELFNG